VSTAEQGDRGFIDWKPQKRSIPFIEHILSVVNYYRDNGYPAPTARDVYYDMIGWYGYKKGDKLNRKVYNLLRKMRRVRSGPYKVPFSAITDDTPTSLVLKTYDDPAHFWSTVKNSAERYHKNLTANQPKRVVVYTEGAGAVKQLHHVARDYAIPVWSGGGWDQLDLKHNTAAAAVAEYRETERETVVLHTGDFDADGVALFKVFIEDVHQFVEDYGEDSSILVFKRVMLTPEQVAGLPEDKKSRIDPADMKERNYRGQKWPLPFKVELQALNLEERLNTMRRAIEAEMDHDQLEEDRRKSPKEYQRVNATVQKLAEEGTR
jgi:hypothetical protein